MKKSKIGDSIVYRADVLDLMKTMDKCSVDCIVTDPPYKVQGGGGTGTYSGYVKSKKYIEGKVFNHNDILPKQYAKEFYRVLKDGSHCYVMTNHVNLYDMLKQFKKAGFHFTKTLIWDKRMKIACPFYMSQFEYILFFRKGKNKMKCINNPSTSDILTIPNYRIKNSDGTNLHDSQKPVQLMKILIENSTKENDLVFEPFMGIGSTCIAAKELNRRFIGCEIDKHYFKESVKRIKDSQTTFG